MTIYHGSTRSMPGHIKVSTFNLRPIITRELEKGWQIPWDLVMNGIQLAPYTFCFHEGKIYYVNGRKQVFETNIFYHSVTLFNPIGHQMISNTVWAPMQFRLMSKVEWVFL